MRGNAHELDETIALLAYPLVLESTSLTDFRDVAPNICLKLFRSHWTNLALGRYSGPHSHLMRSIQSY